ncbi:vesicle-associated membrane protein 2-like isoform X3 [Rhinatrema bivittatum]|uniref:vesicle-associated membrane protein 2-like isoform X3 n=1 Tax=Rhinatrema bivittatum TaxID=194408 RepID=UPI0011265486|nr:vesicle-associated membrane protein 2-like isoform X3 [Rhinatrema bivittatum]
MSAPPAAPAPVGPDGTPAGPPPNLTSNRRLQQSQAQVEEVVDIMRVNVDKVLERDQKLSELDDRADKLQAGAELFETRAAQLKRKYWWKNYDDYDGGYMCCHRGDYHNEIVQRRFM